MQFRRGKDTSKVSLTMLRFITDSSLWVCLLCDSEVFLLIFHLQNFRSFYFNFIFSASSSLVMSWSSFSMSVTNHLQNYLLGTADNSTNCGREWKLSPSEKLLIVRVWKVSFIYLKKKSQQNMFFFRLSYRHSLSFYGIYFLISRFISGHEWTQAHTYIYSKPTRADEGK